MAEIPLPEFVNRLEFDQEFQHHPGRKLWQQYIQAWTSLDSVDQAQHKLADSETFRNYCLALKYGVQIYNYQKSRGRI